MRSRRAQAEAKENLRSLGAVEQFKLALQATNPSLKLWHWHSIRGTHETRARFTGRSPGGPVWFKLRGSGFERRQLNSRDAGDGASDV
eukprot:586640-Rhodomonas_salina.1